MVVVLDTATKPAHFAHLLARCRIPCACHAKPHLNFQKWSEHVVFYILTWKCASHHNGLHFWDMSTSTSVPNLVCFVHFDLGTCFAPQPRALFRHLNFQKWSENGVLCTFWLGNVLRATMACNFHLNTWLRTRRFSEPTFRASGATNHWKNTLLRDFATFSRTCTFLFSDLLSSALLFSDSSHLCFSICPYCRKFDF